MCCFISSKYAIKPKPKLYCFLAERCCRVLWNTASCPLLQLVPMELLFSMSVTFKIVPLAVVPCLWDSVTFLIFRKQKPEWPQGLPRGSSGAISDASGFQQLDRIMAGNSLSVILLTEMQLIYTHRHFIISLPLQLDQYASTKTGWSDGSITDQSIKAGSLLLLLPFCQLMPSVAPREVMYLCSSYFPRGEGWGLH